MTCTGLQLNVHCPAAFCLNNQQFQDLVAVQLVSQILPQGSGAQDICHQDMQIPKGLHQLQGGNCMIQMTLVTFLKDQHQARTPLMTFRLLLNHLTSLEVCQATNTQINNFSPSLIIFCYVQGILKISSEYCQFSLDFYYHEGVKVLKKCCVALVGE